VKLYADDIKIYFEIVNNANVDCLQKGINDLCTWAERWQLKLSVDKCFHLRGGLIKSAPNATYTLYGNQLSLINEARDLGVLIDAQLSLKPHINVIVAKAHMTAGQILRCFRSRDTETLIRAFITYVRQLLEYCTPIWSPYSVGMTKRVESVQRAFTKKLPYMKCLTYKKRLSAFCQESLELRHLKADLIVCFKILRGFTDVIPSDFFVVVMPY